MKIRHRRDRSPFVGRALELEALGALLAEDAQVVSLLGAAGMGKTRLAREWLAQERPAEGWRIFCSLIEVRSEGELLAAVASALGLLIDAEGRPADPIPALALALRARGSGVVVLDNVEQVLEPTRALIAALRAGAPQVRWLITSREPLEVEGEASLTLSPLATDDAVALFLSRLEPADAPSAEARGFISGIVGAVDAIPLAVELAAARADLLALPELLERLRRGLEPLYDHRGGRPGHHHTMEAAIAWSWALLEPWEQRALAQLSVFRGGFTVSAAEAVLALEGSGAPPSVLEVVEALARRSLIHPRAEGPAASAPRRFDLYVAVRAFAEARLTEQGDRAAAHLRHAAWALSLGEAPQDLPLFLPPAPPTMEAEVANLRAAFRRLVGSQPRLALSLALSLTRVTPSRVPGAELAEMLGEALGAGGEDPSLMARGYHALVKALISQDRLKEAVPAAEEGLRWAARAADKPARAGLLFYQGFMAFVTGRGSNQEAPLQVPLALFTELGDPRGQGECLRAQALWHRQERRHEESQRLLDEACQRFRDAGYTQGVTFCLANLLFNHMRGGRIGQAQLVGHQAQELCTGLADGRSSQMIKVALGSLLINANELDEAEAMLSGALPPLATMGAVRHTLTTEASLARIAMERGDFEAAATRLARSRTVALEIGDVGTAAIHLGFQGVLLSLSRRYPEADAALAESAEDLSRLGQGYAAGLFTGTRCLNRCLIGDPEGAAQTLDRARAQLTGYDSAEAPLILTLCHHALPLAQRDPAPAAVAAAAAAARGQDPAVSQAARLCAQLLVRLTGDRQGGGAALPRLKVEGDCRSVTLPEGGEIDLSRRRAPRQILVSLVSALRASPGTPMEVDALFEAGWPGQRIDPESASHRVYVAVSTLRGAGLKPWILTRDGGYLLNPALVVDGG